MKQTFLLIILLGIAIACPLFAADEDMSPLKAENMKNPIFQSSLTFLKSPVPVADSEATTEAEMKSYTDKIPGTEQVFKMISIKGGKFKMGSPNSEAGRQEDEGPQVEVEVQPFWIEEHEVTWKEFEQFALRYLQRNRKPSDTLTNNDKSADATAAPTNPWNIGAISHDNAGKVGFPASGMTIYAAQAYCKWLTMLTGRYYRLPTEAEWEYACRAGSETAYSFGDDDGELDDYAWSFLTSEGKSQQVKTKEPNAWGLFDMHGNLSEWVLEHYAKDTYASRKAGASAAPVKPPVSRVGDDGFTNHVARGGNCENDDPADFRSARRQKSESSWAAQDPQYPKSIWWLTDAPYVGFRVVRPLNPPKTEEEAKQYDVDPTVWVEYAERNQR